MLQRPCVGTHIPSRWSRDLLHTHHHPIALRTSWTLAFNGPPRRTRPGRPPPRNRFPGSGVRRRPGLPTAQGSRTRLPASPGTSIMNADGSGQHRLPNTDGGEYPSWSPDGKRIAFNSNLSGDHVMYIVDVDGSGLDLSSVGEGWQVDWSPDGRSILYTSHRVHPDNYTDIYVMRPDGSGVKRLTHARRTPRPGPRTAATSCSPPRDSS